MKMFIPTPVTKITLLVLLTASVSTGQDKAVGVSARSNAPKRSGQHYAILIGCEAYQFVSPLNFCVDDTRLLRDTLIQYAGYSADRVVMLVDDADKAREKPTRGNIINQLSNWLRLPTPEDTVMVFFSGHGVEVEFIRDQLRACKAKRKILILDACHSGAEKGVGQMTAGFLNAVQSGQGLVTLASCEVNEVSYEAPEFKHSAFTYFLAQGLAGAADREGEGNKNGIVSAHELNVYVYDKVRHWAVREGKKQTPQYVAAVQGAIALAYVGNRPLPTKPPPSPAPVAPPKELSLALGGGVNLALVLLPSGDFQMGSPEDEEGRYDDEGPVHRVRIGKAFYMGQTEVTQSQWQAVMGENPSSFKGSGDLPVESVSWDDCQAFCKKLSAKTGRAVRLPSEAEWEYGCRAGSRRAYSFGDSADELEGYAWFDDNSDDKTHAVGGKRANGWGLYDMHGNVWEWCADAWHDSYSGAPTDGSAWTRGGDEGIRVLRCGSWLYGGSDCRSALRNGYTHDDRGNYILGFRVVVVASSPGTR